MAGTGEHVVKIRAELDNAVVLRPGDKLVIGIARSIDQATAHHMKERLAKVPPGVEPVIIDDCTALAVCEAAPLVRPDDWHPTDVELSTWIRIHEPEFKAWVAKQARIQGGDAHIRGGG